MPPTLNGNDPRSIAAYIDMRVHPLAQAIELAKTAQVAAEAEKTAREVEKVRDSLIEFNSRTFDKAQSYTTVIIAGAYVGMFSVWSSSKDALSAKGSIAIALCLTTSLTFFVLYEIAGTAIRTSGFLRLKREVAKAKTTADYAAYIERERKREARAGLRFVPAYAISLALTLLPAMVAAGLLIYNTAAKLVGWPNWPV